MKFLQYSSDLLDDDQFTTEVLSVDRLEVLATQLAKDLKLMKTSDKRFNLLPEIKKSSEELLEAYLFFTKDLINENRTPALEWFLDNFHIIEDQLRSIKRDLPKDFYDELPKISDGEFAGYPRVYAIAYTYVKKTDSRLDTDAIKRFVAAYQRVSPLTIGELWAIAITFRISLIKQLHPLVDRIIFSRHKREEADTIADKLLEMATKKDTRPDDLVKYLSESIGKQDKFNRPLLVQLIQRLRDQDPSISSPVTPARDRSSSRNSSVKPRPR
jgi:cyclic beta-1,2-glucan synthetase